MQHSVTIGIHDNQGYACTMLNQEGIPFEQIQTIKNGIKEGIKVFIWNKQDKVFNRPDLLDEEIVVITDNFFLSSIIDKQPLVTDSYYFEIEEKPFSPKSFFVDMPVAFLEEESLGKCYDKNDKCINNSGIVIKKVGKITFISYPWNFINHQVGSKWNYRPFYSEKTGKHFVEVGPCIDYGAFRRLFFETICYSSRLLNTGFVRLNPKSGKVFSVRIDADGFSAESTHRVIEIAKKINAGFTWFIDVEGWKDNLRYLNDLAGNNQEVQLHCYDHVTYKSKHVNVINLKKGVNALIEKGFSPSSVVSPFGYNFEGFRDALKKLGFTYSSEFGYSVDDLPSFPLNDRSFPLQVPVHCGSIGVFNNSGFTKEEIFEHIENVVDKQIQADGIAIIYDHPLNRMEKYEEEFVDLFKRLIAKGYRYINMTDYFNFWLEHIKNKEDIQHLEAFGAEEYVKEAGESGIRAGKSISVNDVFKFPLPDIIEMVDANNLNLQSKQLKISIFKYYYKKLKNFLRGKK